MGDTLILVAQVIILFVSGTAIYYKGRYDECKALLKLMEDINKEQEHGRTSR